MPHQASFQPVALRRAREAAGLTQSELARRIGVAGGERVSLWERGAAVPRAATMRRLAEVLSVEVGDLELEDFSSLRSLRRSAGMSLDELAAKVHVARATVYRWETSTSPPTLPRTTVRLLAESLGVGVGAIIEALSAREVT